MTQSETTDQTLLTEPFAFYTFGDMGGNLSQNFETKLARDLFPSLMRLKWVWD